MSRFLFTMWPFSGHVHPNIAVANSLRERGHDVAFYTGESVRSTVEGEGFRLFPFTCVDENHVSEIIASGFPYTSSFVKRLVTVPKIARSFRAWLLETIPDQINDLNRILEEWRPDAIVCDPSMWGPILVLRETVGIPVAVLSVAAACMIPGPDAPPWGQGLPRPRHRSSKATLKIQELVLHWATASFRQHVNRMRGLWRLPPISCSVTELAGRMPLYLIPSAPEYDYQRRDLPPSVHYVGPCVWDKPGRVPAPAWLRQLPAERPLIYATEATVGTEEPFLLKAAAEAVRDLPVELVMTTGRQRNPNMLNLRTSANVRVEAYIPQSDLMPRTAAMITPGGSGGVVTALMAGVPLVVVPTEWDRPENAQRIVESGTGIRIPPNRCSPKALKKAIVRVLTEPSFKQNADRIARALQRCGGPSHAAELIEQLTAPAKSLPLISRSSGDGVSG